MGSVAERRVDWEESELGEAASRPTEENWSMSPRKPRRVGGCSADADAEAEVESVGGWAGAGARRGSGPWEAERRERVSVAARTWAERPAMALSGRRRAGDGGRARETVAYLYTMYHTRLTSGQFGPIHGCIHPPSSCASTHS